MPKHDNTTLRQKVRLRQEVLKGLPGACVLETHGGYGRIFEACYQRCAPGVVFEKDPRKTAVLARQRPEWAVYECDCVTALAGGVGADWPITLVDCDPHGAPWPALQAFFASERVFPDRLGVVVNDGSRQNLQLNHGWVVKSFERVVEQWGNDALYDDYLAVCQALVEEMAAQRGYVLRRWAGSYVGHQGAMTHYAAILEKS